MVQRVINRYKEMFFQDLTALGGVLFYVLVLFFLLHKDYSIFIKLLLGSILIYLITIIIRIIYFKERPKKYTYSNIVEKVDASSFPSLHATRATFLNLTLMKYFNDLIYSIILVLLIILVAYSRMYLKKHDLKDVTGGIVLGILVYGLLNSI